MATDLEKLVVQLSADVKGFEKGMAKAVGVSNKQFNAVERRARQMNKNLDGIFAKSFKGLATPLAGVGAALGVNELRKMTDTWTDMNSRITLATGSQEKGTEVMGRLGDMARRTYSDLTLTAESYLANATALKELGYSTDQSLDYTESLNNALVVSGAKGEKAAQVQDALAKAMGLGKLSGDNLNTVLASGGRVAEALAAGLNTTVGGLRKLGTEGKITGKALVNALSSQMEILRKEAADMPATIGDGFTLLNNALLQYVGNADSATGVSAKISEALVIIADNFDTVADGALQVAAVIAGALVGRSLLGMIKTLGLTTTALISFTRALAAAKSMGALATAFGGLGAAAGPLGAIIGGALVLSIGSYAKASWDAAKNSDALKAEMEKLGIYSTKASIGLDAAAESLDKLTAAETVRKLKQINDELDRLRGGGGIFGQGDELGSIADSALSPLKSIYGQAATSDEDKAGRRQIAQMADDFAKFKISADEVKAKLNDINNTNISSGVVELGNRLRETVELIAANEAYSVKFGDTLEQNVAKVAVSIEGLKQEFKDASDAGIISQDQYNQLEKLVDDFKTTGRGAETLRVALKDIEKGAPNLDTMIERFNGLINTMLVTISTAQAAGRALSMAIALGPDENKVSRATADPYIIQRNAENEIAANFEKNALRKAGLKKDELAMENKLADVRKRLLDLGVANPEKGLAERISKAELAAEASRSSEGKKPTAAKAPKKTEDDYFFQLTQQVKDHTAALAEEAKITGLTYIEQEKRRTAIEMEQSALERLREEARKKGDKDWESVKLSPDQVSAINAVSEAYAKQADELRKVQEAQDRAESGAQEFYDSFKSGIVGAITGAESLTDALAGILEKLAQMLLNSAFDAIMSGATGSGGWLTGAFKAIGFADGGYTGDGGKSQPAGVVHKGEYVFDQAAVRAAGGPQALEAMRRGLKGYANGGYVGAMPALSAPKMPNLKAPANNNGSMSMTFAPVIDARGADQAAVDRLQRGLEKTNREMEARVIQTVRKAQKSNVRF